ncbi:MAG: hypothetical protein K2Z80_21870 [Xanthobacteraceae bacterium]|nr:hypothetical protein [Xanthobacteraceae bacterium]
MNAHRFDFSIRKSASQAVLAAARAKAAIVTAAALASLGAILLAGNPAEAKPNSVADRNKKYDGCYTCCQNKYDINELGGKAYSDKVSDCLTRTCNKQYRSCLANVTPGKLETPGGIRQPRGADAWGPNIIDTRKDEYQGRARPTGAYSPISGGILDTGLTVSGQGPSSTGSPAGGGRAPSAPAAAGPIIR